MASLALLETVLVYLVVSTLAKGDYELEDLTFTAVDLNVTIMWSPLNIDVWENETIYYTVIHEGLYSEDNKDVSGCTDLTRVVCNLVHIFGDGNNFDFNEHFEVTFASDQRPEVSGSKRKTLFNFYVDVSAPVIHSTIVNARDVTVSLHAPPTPFKKNNITLFMGDYNVGGNLFEEKLCFKSSLSNLDDPNDNDRSSDWICSRNGRHTVIYNDLHPYTRYVFKAYNKIQYSRKDWQNNFVTWEFRTTQEAPEFSPYITHHDVKKRSCDVRDVAITWQERTQQRSNVGITHYIVTCVSKESDEQIEISIPASQNQSTVIRGLYRWTNHTVTVRSVNSHGNATSEAYHIPPDEPQPESYSVRNVNITEISERSAHRRLSWDPPSRNTECIIGYQIRTFIDGSREQSITLLGDERSLDLKFQRSGRYIVELEPIVNNSKGITGDTSIEYDVNGNNLVKWIVLAVIFFLVCLTLTAVIVMTRKVFCDVSRLPDFTKTLSVRLASNSDVFIGTLKSPPDREYFHATRSSHTTSIMLTTHYGDDDVFEPTSTSTSQLLTKPKDPKKEDKPSDGISDRDKLKPDTTYIKLSTYMTTKKADDTTDASSAELRTSGHVQADGYVAHHSVKVKTDLTVYIPKEEQIKKTTEGAVSPQSSSSDSGISSSAYTGSLSDCVPPSPFSDIDTSSPDKSHDIWYGYDIQSSDPFVKSDLHKQEGLESPYVKRAAPCTRDSYGYDFKSASPYVKSCTAPEEMPPGQDSPYVKSELAGKPGRIKSTSDPGVDRSAQSVVYLKGYLPMSPSIPENFDHYSKLSPKY